MKKIVLIILFMFPAIIAIAQNQIKTTGANVNFRRDPWIGNNVVCVIPKSTIVSINSEQNFIDWTKIDYNGQVGYVYSKYVTSIQSFSNSIYDYSSTQTKVKHYTNSKGERVQSPTYYKTAPAGASALCRDGTYSFSRNRRGTCSHHGGVRNWL
jgi:uncharacterized protein YraI